MKSLTEHEDRRLNPSVKPGDHIRLISVDYDMLCHQVNMKMNMIYLNI